MHDEQRIRRVLGAPELGRLVDRMRSRAERGEPLTGMLTLDAVDEAERRAVARLIGRPAGGGRSISISLDDLARTLRTAGVAHDLRSALEVLRGPLTDRFAAAAAHERRREQSLAPARACVHAKTPWYGAWLDEIERDGTLTRILGQDRDEALAHVAAVLDLLPADGVALPVLAERAVGDTKALDATPLDRLVLRALCHWHDAEPPGSREARRSLWALAGVALDDLASQVLILNVRAREGGAMASWMCEAAELGEPLRVTLHQLTRFAPTLENDELSVCENPAILRAAAEQLGSSCAPLVCSEGVPSTACHRLVASASQVRWRGDFDWTGVRTVGAAIERHGATPWRMNLFDYRGALSSASLRGTLRGVAAPTPWDPGLSGEMEQASVAVMEERLLDLLIEDLA